MVLTMDLEKDFMTPIESATLEHLSHPKPLLLTFSEKIVEIAARNKDQILDTTTLMRVMAMYGLTDAQRVLYLDTLQEARHIFDSTETTHSKVEYVHAVLEGYV